MKSFSSNYSYDIGQLVFVHIRPGAIMAGIVREISFDLPDVTRVEVRYKVHLLYKNHNISVPEDDLYDQPYAAMGAMASDAVQVKEHNETEVVMHATDIHGNRL